MFSDINPLLTTYSINKHILQNIQEMEIIGILGQ